MPHSGKVKIVFEIHILQNNKLKYNIRLCHDTQNWSTGASYWLSVTCFNNLIEVILWQIQLIGHDLETHTPVYVRPHSRHHIITLFSWRTIKPHTRWYRDNSKLEAKTWLSGFCFFFHKVSRFHVSVYLWSPALEYHQNGGKNQHNHTFVSST